MKTLIIYDTDGTIYYQAAGAVTAPQGLPHMWVDIPEGKHLVSIDTSGDAPTPIFEDNPRSDVQLLEDEITELQYLVAQIGGGLNG